MYPGLKLFEVINPDELTQNYEACLDLLHYRNYVCNPKTDYPNERKILELKQKKKAQKELEILDMDVAQPFNWNQLYASRIDLYVHDALALQSTAASNQNELNARQLIEMSRKGAGIHVRRNLDIAKDLVRNLIAYRKKNKTLSQKKLATPLEFWDQEITTRFRNIEENSFSSAALQKQISNYIMQGCTTYANELSTGHIPDDFSAGIEFYLNYILRIIQTQVPDADINNAMNSRSNMLDALSEYSLGQMMSIFKLVFYSLYNPESGALVGDRDQLVSYMTGDLKSWGNIIIKRIRIQFKQLADPIFSSLIDAVVMNAMFVIATPLLQNEIRRLHDNESRRFIEVVNQTKATDPNKFGVHPLLLDNVVEPIVAKIDQMIDVIAPKQKLQAYQVVMSDLYSYLYQKLSDDHSSDDAATTMNYVSTFVLLMDPESVVLNLHYLLLFKQVTTLNPYQDSTLTYLTNSYQSLCSLLGVY